MVCNTCINTGRAAHRHSMLWTRVVKVNVKAPRQMGHNKQCDRCGQRYFSNFFLGLECTGCRQYHCCLPCVHKNNFPMHAFFSGKPAAFDFFSYQRLKRWETRGDVVSYYKDITFDSSRTGKGGGFDVKPALWSMMIDVLARHIRRTTRRAQL